MTSQWHHQNKIHTSYSGLNFLQNVNFGIFRFWKLTRWCCFGMSLVIVTSETLENVFNCFICELNANLTCVCRCSFHRLVVDLHLISTSYTSTDLDCRIGNWARSASVDWVRSASVDWVVSHSIQTALLLTPCQLLELNWRTNLGHVSQCHIKPYISTETELGRVILYLFYVQFANCLFFVVPRF